MKRYHKSVYMPELDVVKFWNNIKSLGFSKHFKERYNERKHEHSLMFPTVDRLKGGEIFELYMEHNKVIKVCVRVSGKKNDSCFVVSNDGYVITTWSTSKNNKYEKIDLSIYARR